MSDAHITLLAVAKRLVDEQDGVTAIEYGLLAALIAMTCVVAFQLVGTSLNALWAYWVSAVLGAL